MRGTSNIPEVLDPASRAPPDAGRAGARGITRWCWPGPNRPLRPSCCRYASMRSLLGAIATNGLRHISKSVGLKIHISVWGNDDTSLRFRNAKDMLVRQIDNYRKTPGRFLCTPSPHTISSRPPGWLKRSPGEGCKLTFNIVFRACGVLRAAAPYTRSLLQTRQAMLDLLARYPESVLYSPYNAMAHTHQLVAARFVRLCSSALQSFDGHRPGTLISPVPYRSELGSMRPLRTRYRLLRLPPLRGRQRGGHGPPVSPCLRPGSIQLLVGLCGHLPGRVGHGSRQRTNLCRVPVPARF